MKLEAFEVACLALITCAILSVAADGVAAPAVAPVHQGAAKCLGATSCPPSEGEGQSLERLRRAALAGEAEAAFQLGALYASRAHPPTDDARAEGWLRRAATNEHVEAQHLLGMLLLEPGASDERVMEGLFWLGAATAQGDAFSAVVLGKLHEEGLRGVARDVCLAVDWYEASEMMGAEGPPGFLAALKQGPAADC